MKPKKWELIFVLCLALLLALWAFWPKKQGGAVTVTVDGAAVGTYPLSENLSLPISGYGGFSLTLVIDGGQTHVEGSTCPDLICQHHSPISKSGEQIVCLPARIVITVTGHDTGGVDAVAG